MCTALHVLYGLRAQAPVNRLDVHVHDSTFHSFARVGEGGHGVHSKTLLPKLRAISTK